VALTKDDGPNRGASSVTPRGLPKSEPRRPRNVAEAIAAGSYRQGGTPSRLEFHGLPSQYDAHLPVRGPLVADMAKAENTRKAQADRTASMYDNMAARQRMDEKRLAREKVDRTETDKVLTAEEWVKLTPLQQAAAQANFDLDAAIKKDFADQGKHSANSSQKEGGTERVKDYMQRVDELFGEDGSVGFKGLRFAPNTLAFLESRGIDKDELGGKTLDDIVSGDALIDEEAFAALGQNVKSDDPRALKVSFAKTLAKGQLAYQEKLAAQLQRGDQLLSDVTGRDTNSRASTTYGANLMPERAKMTEVRPDLVGQIDKYMQALARTDIPLDQALETISLDLSEVGASDKERAQIWENMIERSRAATTGEAQWFDGVDFEMRNPVEVAQALGAPTLKREGAK
jgi:hypothetical protein